MAAGNNGQGSFQYLADKEAEIGVVSVEPGGH
jgi:hypothetical protein